MGEPALILLNPFRDRSPERACDKFFRRLKVGDFDTASASARLPTAEWGYLVEKEREHPLVSWSLANRSNKEGSVDLFYWVRRRDYDGDKGPLWITVSRSGNGGKWTVERFEAWY